jgi:hypothetical protein
MRPRFDLAAQELVFVGAVGRADPDGRADPPLNGRTSSPPPSCEHSRKTEEAVTMHEVAHESETGATAPTPTWEILELRRTIARMREAVAQLDLSPMADEPVSQALEAASQEAGLERPDRYIVGEHLEEAARALKEAGHLDPVSRTLRRAIELLGPAGLATVATAL